MPATDPGGAVLGRRRPSAAQAGSGGPALADARPAARGAASLAGAVPGRYRGRPGRLPRCPGCGRSDHLCSHRAAGRSHPRALAPARGDGRCPGMSRNAKVSRKTKETELDVAVELDGRGDAQVSTGIPFFDHMLETLAKHSALDVRIECKGDLHIDQHHTVEDTGIALGSAIDEALGDRKGIARAGCFYFPLDEALARTVVDLSGRSYLHWNVSLDQGPRSAMDISVLEGFFKALADHTRANVHIDLLTGRDFQHGADSVLKRFARALPLATSLGPQIASASPSTKGAL